MLFVYLCIFMMILSAVLAYFKVSTIHPVTKKEIAITSLLTMNGVHWLLTNLIKNFVNFPPLGPVILLMMGIGLADKSGLLFTSLSAAMQSVPSKLVTLAVVLVGLSGHIASDACLLIVPPLGALAFLAKKRHPLAGYCAAMAGASAGFSANFLIVNTDILLSGISTPAAKMIDPNMVVNATDNWFFMSASVAILAVAGAIVTEKIVEPRIGPYTGTLTKRLEEITPEKKKALKATGIVLLLFIGLLVALVAPDYGFLRNPKTNSIIQGPFIQGIVPILFTFFVVLSVTFGKFAGTIKSTKDFVKMLSNSIKEMSGMIVVVFICAQFVAFFDWTNMGIWLAVSGADFLKGIHLTGFLVIIAFSLVAGFCALFIASGSALWAVLAPVFMPMLMLLGYQPALIQVAYRIADSATNTITPINQYLPVILSYYQEYKEGSGIGTVFSTMLPYSIVSWSYGSYNWRSGIT